MSSSLDDALRRLKPDKQRARLTARPPSQLPFLDFSAALPRSVLYDTTVYVDFLHDRFPRSGEVLIRAAGAWHSTVAQAELAAVCGLLDPLHVETRDVIRRVTEVAGRISPHRLLTPDIQVWNEAAVLTGTICRLQGVQKADRKRLLNDALIFVTARKYGHAVLTRNVADFDLLQQLDPSGRLLFYRV